MHARRIVGVVVRRAACVALPARTATAAPTACRAFSTVISSPFEKPDADFVMFPREGRGLDYGLNWSLADDGVTPRGMAFRNPEVKELLMQATGPVDKDSKVLACGLGADDTAPLFCTDEHEGFVVADIDEFESRFETLKESFSLAPALFVEDGAVGSDRRSEIRVRVISDSANYALFFRNMLVRVPLKDPQTIPRPLTVYISTSLSQGNFSVSDFDPDTGRGVVAVGGSPGFEAVRRQVEHVASQMFSHGGYQGQRGGGRRIQLAREDGTLDWADDHYTATSGADELLFIQRHAYTGADGSTTIAVGTDVSDDGLYAGHACVWNPAGVAQFWGGANLPDAAAGGAQHTVSCTGRTAVLNDGAAHTAAHPSKIVVEGGAKDAAELAAKLGLSEAAAALLEARVKEHGVSIVKATAANAAGAAAAPAAAAAKPAASAGKSKSKAKKKAAGGKKKKN